MLEVLLQKRSLRGHACSVLVGDTGAVVDAGRPGDTVLAIAHSGAAAAALVHWLLLGGTFEEAPAQPPAGSRGSSAAGRPPRSAGADSSAEGPRAPAAFVDDSAASFSTNGVSFSAASSATHSLRRVGSGACTALP